jgi:hypothetical protein
VNGQPQPSALPSNPHDTSNRKTIGFLSLSRQFLNDRSLLRLLGFESGIIQPLMKLHLLRKAISAGKIQTHFNPYKKYQYGSLCSERTKKTEELLRWGKHLYH